MLRTPLCEWCGLPVADLHVRLVAYTATDYRPTGAFCDPSCLRSWADEFSVPSSKPGRTVIIAHPNQDDSTSNLSPEPARAMTVHEVAGCDPEVDDCLAGDAYDCPTQPKKVEGGRD